jgi:uncharacterized lipoprotein YmbA
MWSSTLKKRGCVYQGAVENLLKAHPALLALPIEQQLQQEVKPPGAQ